MPLVDLKTDLTSLRFGRDRPGGGSSGEPFVQDKSLKRRIAEDGIETLGNTGGSDLFIRGGGKVGPSTEKDLERLGKYFKTTEGRSFVAQQNLLSLTGVRIYGGYPTQVKFVNTFKFNDGVYLPLGLSTIAAAAGVAFGGHPNKQGIDFSGNEDSFSRPQYLNLVKGGLANTGFQGGIAEKKNNRLVNLFAKRIAGLPLVSVDTDPPIGGILGDFLFNNSLVRGIRDFTSQLSSRENNENLYSYLGGPQSGRDGLGKTFIKVGGDSPSRQNGGAILVGNNIEDKAFSLNSSPLKFSTFSQEQISSFTPIKDSFTTLVEDFRNSLKEKPTSFISKSPSYSKKNIENRVNLGNPGTRGQDRSDYAKGNPANDRGLDKINSIYIRVQVLLLIKLKTI